jgi:nitroreductase
MSSSPLEITPQSTAAVDHAIESRHSTRAFLDREVPQALIEEVLRVASWAPSGTNTQPWQVHVLTGASKAALSTSIQAAFDDPVERAQHTEAYAYYPVEWRSPYIDRRRKVGWDLYTLLGIGKQDKEKMHAQHGRNYHFFGAPVGLMFTIDQVMQQGSWLDYGMFLQSVMVAARARGLATCPQAAFTQFHRIILPHLKCGPEQMLVCGMALGWPDEHALVNSLRTERAPVSQFTTFHST